MTAQQRLRPGPGHGVDRFELSDDASATDNGVALATMLDTVEQVGETSRGVGRGHFGHGIGLSDQLGERHEAPGVGAAIAWVRSCAIALLGDLGDSGL